MVQRKNDSLEVSNFWITYNDLTSDINLVAEHPENKPCRYIEVPVADKGDLLLERTLDGEQALVLEWSTDKICLVKANKIIASGTTATRCTVYW